jgi:hypothetical protein
MRFISEAVTVSFDEPPVLEKRPGCPNAFTWRGKAYRIVRRLSEWHDYKRRGRMLRNMRPEHAARAGQRGSRGVGRDYYRVLTDTEQVFDLYYDRAPKDVFRCKGGWFLYQELS